MKGPGNYSVFLLKMKTYQGFYGWRTQMNLYSNGKPQKEVET